MKNKITVIGSSNTDMVIQSDRLPAPGETVIGNRFSRHHGGKGANQAVAVARLAGDVTFVCRVGNDVFGREAIAHYRQSGIDTSYITTDPIEPSGTALILVDSHGENSISVALGANQNLDGTLVKESASAIQDSSYVLTQLETPLKAIEVIGVICKQHKVPLILNPAPALELSDELLSHVDIITPNAIEAYHLTGIKLDDDKSLQDACSQLHERGVDTVIITLGDRGAYLSDPNYRGIIATDKVDVVDTTAAGDTFNGALIVALSEGYKVPDAVRFANQAAAYSVGKLGAQSSIPYRKDL
jgi:ribokinase